MIIMPLAMAEFEYIFSIFSTPNNSLFSLLLHLQSSCPLNANRWKWILSKPRTRDIAF